MEIELRLERIDNKIEQYNEKIEVLSNLIKSLIHAFQQNQLPSVKNEILNAIQEKFNNSENNIDIEEIKSFLNQTQIDLKENQDSLKLKIVEVETIIKKINDLIENFSIDNTNIQLDENSKTQLTNIEKCLKKITKEIVSLKNIQDKEENSSQNTIDETKIESLSTLISSQITANIDFQKNVEYSFNELKTTINNLQSINLSHTESKDDNAIQEIKDKFDDLNLAITSVLSAIKIVDKKYNELKSFELIIDKLTTDVVSPILLASSDVKAFVEKTTVNFEKINEFVQEYDHGAFLRLQEKIDNIDLNVNKISENVNIDVNKLLDLVDEFKNNSNSSNQIIREKIDNIDLNVNKISENVNIDVNKLLDLVDEFKNNSNSSNQVINDNMEKIENMLITYNDNLSELTKTATSEVISNEVKALNDEFYLELLTLFNSLSFDEETEDIKDFIENILSSINYKTDENTEKLNNIMMQFKNLLYKIESIEKAQNSISDYLKPEITDDLLYSFDDIQTDLAKMRLVLNEISESVTSSHLVDEISEKIKITAEQIENLSAQITNNENKDNENLKEQIEALNSQVNDISIRTNKLLLTNEDSTIELKNNLEVFKDVFDKANPEKMYELFYELTHYFNDVNEKINQVIEVTKVSHNETITIKNALIYVGEWLDSATNVLEEIRANSKNEFKKTNDINLEEEFLILKKTFEQEVSEIKISLKVYEQKIENRLANIEDKIDKLLNQKTTTKESISKTATTQLKSIDKKFGEMEEVLSKLSEKLMKE